MESVYDMTVAWRIYPGVSKKPIIFPENKFLLARTSIISFIKSVTDLKVKYYFILDGCPDSYEQMIRSLITKEDVVIVKTDKIGNWATFKKQIEILTTQSESEVVYFAEDDYLYKPGEFHKMIRLLKQGNGYEFVSCYEHMDTFSHPIHQHPKKIINFVEQEWHTDSSTCLTFLTTKKILKGTASLFLTYSNGNNDCAVWLVITKQFILNPISYIRFYFSSRESFNILKMAVKYSFKFFFKTPKYNLWVPHPAIGTHLESGLESPGVNWIQISNDINVVN